MLQALRAGAHRALGFASFSEYIGRLFDYTPRWTAERLRVTAALEQLPEIDQALRDGALSWSAVRELTRVAVRETQGVWLARAKGRPLRELERAVAGRIEGDTPDTPPDPALVRHVLRFEVTAETLALFRQAQAALCRDTGGALDDDDVLMEMARRVLGGPADTGRASYQVALTVCEHCGRGEQTGRGEPVEVGPEVVEMALCDVQRIGSTDVATHVGGADAAGSPDGEPNKAPRAKQDVPPALRRKVMRRDHGRCVVPGCSNAVFVDVHHIELRSEGGAHDEDTLAVVCGAHHRALHRGQLLVTGRVSTGLDFRHADGTPYGAHVSAEDVDAYVEVHKALRTMGFREGETKRALEQVRQRPHVGAGVEPGLREALFVLSEPRTACATPARSGASRPTCPEVAPLRG